MCNFNVLGSRHEYPYSSVLHLNDSLHLFLRLVGTRNTVTFDNHSLIRMIHCRAQNNGEASHSILQPMSPFGSQCFRQREKSNISIP